MLLRALYEYGLSKNLATDNKQAYIGNILRLTRNGATLEKLEKLQKIDVPKEKRSGNVNPYLGYDSAEYVLGTGRAGRKDKEGRSPFEAFWERLGALCEASGDEDAGRAVRAAVQDAGWLREARKAAGEGNIAIAIGDDMLLERRAVRAYLKKTFEDKIGGEDGPDTCLLTGEKCHAAVLHDPIHGVPGTGGDFAFVSFNFPSVSQPGFSQGENFPVSQVAMVTYTSGFNALIATNLAKIGEDTSVVVWGPEGAENIARVVSPYTKNEDRPAAWKAVEKLKSTVDCHILFLKGSKGRISVLGYERIPTSRVVAALRKFRALYGRLDVEFVQDEPKKGQKRAPGYRIVRWDKDKTSIVQELRNTGPKPNMQPLDDFVKVDAVRSVLLGQAPGKRMELAVVAALQDRQVVKGTWTSRAQLRWFEYMRLYDSDVGAEGEDRVTEQTTSEPQQHEYMITSREERTTAYVMGQLIAIGDAMRRQYHRGRRLSGNQVISSVNTACMSPAMWFRDFGREVEIYQTRLRASGKVVWPFHKMLADAFQDCIKWLLDDQTVTQTRPLPVGKQATLMLGYQHQKNFNKAYAQWSYATRTNGSKESGAPDDAAVDDGSEVEEDEGNEEAAAE